VAAAIVLATASIRTGASTNTSTKCFICTRRPDGSGGDRTRLKTSLSAHHRVQLAWSSARCGIIITVSAGRRTLPQACHHSPRNIHLEPPFRPSRPGHLTACARPSIHLHYYHYCTPIPSLLHRRCDASLCLAAARGASHCPAPNHGPSQVPLLKRTHPDAGLHTPCYSCPTHSRPLALAAPHVATLGSRALQIQSPSRQTCLLRLRNTAPTTTPSIRFLRIPSSPSSDSGSRDFTFIGGYLRFTLRRFTSQRPPLHARH
jgi:hypothetical protein